MRVSLKRTTFVYVCEGGPTRYVVADTRLARLRLDLWCEQVVTTDLTPPSHELTMNFGRFMAGTSNSPVLRSVLV